MWYISPVNFTIGYERESFFVEWFRNYASSKIGNPNVKFLFNHSETDWNENIISRITRKRIFEHSKNQFLLKKHHRLQLIFFLENIYIENYYFFNSFVTYQILIEIDF